MTDHVHTEDCDHGHEHSEAEVAFVTNLIQLKKKDEQAIRMLATLMEATKRALKISMLQTQDAKQFVTPSAKTTEITIDIPEGAELVDLVDGPECPVEVLISQLVFFIDENGEVDLRPVHKV